MVLTEDGLVTAVDLAAHLRRPAAGLNWTEFRDCLLRHQSESPAAARAADGTGGGAAPPAKVRRWAAARWRRGVARRGLSGGGCGRLPARVVHSRVGVCGGVPL